MTTLGKYRHLETCSTPAGHFMILAIDHRANLRAALDAQAPAPLTDDQFAQFKQQVMGHLCTSASAVLADPAYGLGPGITTGAIPGGIGLLAPIEETDYTLHPTQRADRFIAGWSVGKLKRMGGGGLKLLLYYHPAAPNAAAQRDIVARMVEECAHHDLPFYLEPITYTLDPQTPLTNAELLQISVEMARTFSMMGVDILKLAFPVDVANEPDEARWQSAAEALDSACTVPWALLSAGVDYPTFARQARVACAAGASGVIVGRAIWAEAVNLQGEARQGFLATTAQARMAELGGICAQYAQPWRKRVPTPASPPDWYTHYGE